MNLRHLNRRDIRKDVSVCPYCVGHNARWWEKPDYKELLDEHIQPIPTVELVDELVKRGIIEFSE